MMGRRHIPAFGNWDYSDELPITQYFESAAHAGLLRGPYFGDGAELLKVASAPVKPVVYRKVKSRSGGADARKPLDEMPQRKRQERRDVREVAAARHSPQRRRPGRAPKAVDEDLYKIPPEMLCQKPKRNWFLRSVWPACLGINCVA